MLEECGLEYRAHAVNIGKGEQHQPEFLAISPNNRIPAIVDQDGPGGKPLSVFESGAILIYLAEKTGKFYSANLRDQTQINQWLMWQMSGVGPMLGQNHHFVCKKRMSTTMLCLKALVKSSRLGTIKISCVIHGLDFCIPHLVIRIILLWSIIFLKLEQLTHCC